MATILVDYENVNGTNGLKGADALCSEDTLMIFYSNCCGKIRYDYMQDIKESGCEFHIVKLKGTGKNALDFYIAAECGVISERGERRIAIISNDKGFQAVIDFFCVNRDTARVQIVKAGNIETAITLFSSPEEAERKAFLQRRMSTLDLAAECARLEERNAMRREIQDILQGTQYEERTAEIIDFITVKAKKGKKALYTESLHTFGRKDGLAIYQMVRQIVESETENKNEKAE